MNFNIKKLFKSFGVTFISCISILSQVSACESTVSPENNDSPKVSVLMPVYNSEKYLRKSLDSVLNQSLKDIELICVNDGSKDNSLEILKEYAEKDSRLVLVDQVNQGAAVARQNAIKKAKGEYIAFVDSDDIIDQNAYETAYDSIKKYDADILCFGWRNFSDESDNVVRNNCEFNELTIYDNWYKAKKHRGSIYLWNKLYKRSLITDNDVVFDPKVKIAEDEGFNLCAYSNAKKVVHIPYTFYNYRVNPNSLMCKASAFKVIKNYSKMLKYVEKYYRKHNVKIKIHELIGYLTVYKDEIVPLIKTITGIDKYKELLNFISTGVDSIINAGFLKR